MDRNSRDGNNGATTSSSKSQVGEASGKPTHVRKSSRPRKRTKKVLDIVEVDSPEPEASPAKKKANKKQTNKKTRKDFLDNGRPFVCSLCNSKCINPSRVKRKHGPVYKERDGQTLQLCIDCGIAVSHTETRGPSQEQKQEFEREGQKFGQHLAKYLGDNEAIRLYCSFYAIYKCGCIQNFIHGSSQSKRKKYSCTDPDIPSLLPQECFDPPDDKVDQAQKARYLLQLLKESKKRKNLLRSKRSRTSSNQSVSSVRSLDSQSGGDTDTGSTSCAAAGQSGDHHDQRVVHQKRLESFILAHRSKLKKIGICERGCQRVLCYSNNFLHKKSVFGKEARLQRTKGKAALGQLDAVEELPKLTCCDKACVKFAELKPMKVKQWRNQAQQSQRESWKVISEILTSPQITGGRHQSCFRFITMVTGCCTATVRKVYAETLFAKGQVIDKEHGLRYHWRRQKQGMKSVSESSSVHVKQEPFALKFEIAQQTASALAGDVLSSVPTNFKYSQSISWQSQRSSTKDKSQLASPSPINESVSWKPLQPFAMTSILPNPNSDDLRPKSSMPDEATASSSSIESTEPSQNFQVIPAHTVEPATQPVKINVCVTSSFSSVPLNTDHKRQSQPSELESSSTFVPVSAPLSTSSVSGLRNSSQSTDRLQQILQSERFPVQTTTISDLPLTQSQTSQLSSSSMNLSTDGHNASSSMPELGTQSHTVLQPSLNPENATIGSKLKRETVSKEPQRRLSVIEKDICHVQNDKPVMQADYHLPVRPVSSQSTMNQSFAGGQTSQSSSTIAQLSSVQRILISDNQAFHVQNNTLSTLTSKNEDSQSHVPMPSLSSNLCNSDGNRALSMNNSHSSTVQNSDSKGVRNLRPEVDTSINFQTLQEEHTEKREFKKSPQQIPSPLNIQEQEKMQSQTSENCVTLGTELVQHITAPAQDVEKDETQQQKQPTILGHQDCTLITVLENGVPKFYVVPKTPVPSSSASSLTATTTTFSSLPPTAIPVEGSVLPATGILPQLSQPMETAQGLSKLLSQNQLLPSTTQVMGNQSDPKSSQSQDPLNQHQVTSSHSQATSSQEQIISSEPAHTSNVASETLHPVSHPNNASLGMSSANDQIVSSKPRVSSVVQASPCSSTSKSVMDQPIDLVNPSSSCSCMEDKTTVSKYSESSQLPKLNTDIDIAIKSALCQQNYQTNSSTDGLTPPDQSQGSLGDDSTLKQDQDKNNGPTLSLESGPAGSSYKPETGDSYSGSPVFVPRGESLSRNLSMDGASLSSDILFHPVTCSPSSFVFDALSDSPMNHHLLSSLLSDHMLGSCRRLSFSGHSTTGPQTTLTSPIQLEFFSKFFSSTRSGSSSSSRQSPVFSSHQTPASHSLSGLTQILPSQFYDERLVRLGTNSSPVCGSEGRYTTPSAFSTQLTPSAGEYFHHPSASHSSSNLSIKTSNSSSAVPEVTRIDLSSTLTGSKPRVPTDLPVDQLSIVTKPSAHHSTETNVLPQTPNSKTTETAMISMASPTGPSRVLATSVYDTEVRGGLLLQRLLSSDPMVPTLPQTSSILTSNVNTETAFCSSASSLPRPTEINLTSTNSFRQEQMDGVPRTRNETKIEITNKETLCDQRGKIEAAQRVVGTSDASSSSVKYASNQVLEHQTSTAESMVGNVNANSNIQATPSKNHHSLPSAKPTEDEFNSAHFININDVLHQTLQKVYNANGQQQQLVFLTQQEKSQGLKVVPEQIAQQLFQLPQHPSLQEPQQEQGLSQSALQLQQTPKQTQVQLKIIQQMQSPSQNPHQMQPPAQSSQQMQPPSQIPHQMQPPAQSSQQMQPPAQSSQQMQPPGESSQQMQPPTQSSQQIQLPSQSPEQFHPLVQNATQIQPHKLPQQPKLIQKLSQQPPERLLKLPHANPQQHEIVQPKGLHSEQSKQQAQSQQVLQQTQMLSQQSQQQLLLQQEANSFPQPQQLQLQQPTKTLMLSQQLQNVLAPQHSQPVILQTHQTTQPAQQLEHSQQLQPVQDSQSILQQFIQTVEPAGNLPTQNLGIPQNLPFQQEQPVSSKTSHPQVSLTSSTTSDQKTTTSQAVQPQTSEASEWMTIPISVPPSGSSSKPPRQRRLMPKLAPVPQSAKTKPKSSFILVPDKPGYPSLPLSSVDPKGLSWLTPGQTVQIRAIMPQTEPMRGSNTQPILVNTSGQQLVLQPVQGQMANLAQVINPLAQPGVKLLNAVQTQQQEQSVQHKDKSVRSISKDLANTQSGIAAPPPCITTSQHKDVLTQKPPKLCNFDQHGSASLNLLPNKLEQNLIADPISTMDNIQTVPNVSSVNDSVIAKPKSISTTSKHQKKANTPDVTDGYVTNQSSTPHSSLGVNQVCSSVIATKPNPECFASFSANQNQKAADQLVMQHQQQSLQNQVRDAKSAPLPSAQEVAGVSEHDQSHLSLILRQLGCSPGMKLIMNKDGTTTVSSNVTFTTLSSASLPNHHFSIPVTVMSNRDAQERLSVSASSANICSIAGNTQTATASGSCHSASSLNVPDKQKDSMLLSVKERKALSNSVIKENPAIVSNQSSYQELPVPDSTPPVRFIHNQFIDLTDELETSPPSTTRPEECLQPMVKRQLPHSNLLFQELSKDIVSSSLRQENVTVLVEGGNKGEVGSEVNDQHSSLKQESKHLRLVSYKNLQNLPLRATQPTFKNEDTSQTDGKTLLYDKLYLPTSVQSGTASSKIKTYLIEPSASQNSSITSDKVILVPKDFQIQQPLANSSTCESFVSEREKLIQSDLQSFSTNISMPRISLSQPKTSQAIINVGTGKLPTPQPSVALPTPAKSHPVESPHKFTLSGNQPQIAYSGVTSTPRLMLSQKSSGPPNESETFPRDLHSSQNTGTPPATPVTGYISSSPRLSLQAQKTQALTSTPKQVSQVSASASIQRPNSIPIVSDSISRNANLSASQTLTFRRTSKTPTDAVGPPNITIVSPSGSSPAQLLKFGASTSSASIASSSADLPLRNLQESITGNQTPPSNVNIATEFTPVRTRANELDMEQGRAEQYPARSDRNLQTSASGKADNVRSILPETAQVIDNSKPNKEIEHVSTALKLPLATDNSASAYRERLLQCHLNPGLKKQNKPRKRSSTINDLLKMKELVLKSKASTISQAQGVAPRTAIPEANCHTAVLNVDPCGQSKHSPAHDPKLLSVSSQNPKVIMMQNQGTPLQIHSGSTAMQKTREKAGTPGSETERISEYVSGYSTTPQAQGPHQQLNQKLFRSESKDLPKASPTETVTAHSQLVNRAPQDPSFNTSQRVFQDISSLKAVWEPINSGCLDQNKEKSMLQQFSEHKSNKMKPLRAAVEIRNRLEPVISYPDGDPDGMNSRVPTINDPSLPTLLSKEQLLGCLHASHLTHKGNFVHLESGMGYTNKAPPAYEEALRRSKDFVNNLHAPPSSSQHQPSSGISEQRASIVRETTEMTAPFQCHDRITKVIDDMYMPEDDKFSSSYEDKEKDFVKGKPKHQSVEIALPGLDNQGFLHMLKEPRKDVPLAQKVMSMELDRHTPFWKVPGVKRKLPVKGKSNAHFKRVQFSEDISTQQTPCRLDDDSIIGLKAQSSGSKGANPKVPFSFMPASQEQLVLKSLAKQSKRSDQHNEFLTGFADDRLHLSQDTLKPTPTTKPLSAVRHSQLVSARHKGTKLETKGKSEDTLGRLQYKGSHDIMFKGDHTSSKQSTLPLTPQTSLTSGSYTVTGSQDNAWMGLQGQVGRDSESVSAHNRPSSFEIISPQGYSRLNRQRLLSTTSSESECSPQVESRPFPSLPKQTLKQPSLANHQMGRASEHNIQRTPSVSKGDPASSEHYEMYIEEGEGTEEDRRIATDSHKVYGNVAALVERQLSESPAIRHNVIQEDYELSQQMSQQNFGASLSNKSSFHSYKPAQTISKELLTTFRDEFKSKMMSADSDERELVQVHNTSRIGQCEPSEEGILGLRVSTNSPSNSSVNSDVSTNFTSASNLSSVDGRLERFCDLMEVNSKLSNQNEMLRRKVTKAEMQAERFQQHGHHHTHTLSPTGAVGMDREERCIGMEEEVSSPSLQTSAVPYPDITSTFLVETFGNPGHRRRSKHPSSSGILKPGPSHDSETDRLLEASTSSGIRRRHLSSGLRVPSDYIETLHRVVPHASPLSFTASKMGSPELVINDCLRIGAGDPLVSSTTLRPPSQLDNEISACSNGFLLSDSGQYRQRYPSTSELKQIFLDLDINPDGTRSRNLSSGLGIRLEPELIYSSTIFDNLQRQRNLSTSSTKDGTAAGNGSGNRSRNPSSSSLRQPLIDFSQPLNVIRSRNPSGSSNRRSRPGSSSSDREFPYVNAGDDLIAFTELIQTRSRNSSGDSNLEPSLTMQVPFDIMQQFFHS